MYAENASTKDAGQFALAEFYHRRAQPLDEIKVLEVVATAKPRVADQTTVPAEQQSWKAFERIFGIIQSQGLGKRFRSPSTAPGWLVIPRSAPSIRAFSISLSRKRITSRQINW